MALWSNTDANTSAPKYAVAGGDGVAADGDTLFNNTTQDAYVTGKAIGVFGVDPVEQEESNDNGGHAGWVLRTEGSGSRAGRVHVETLVAMGSMTGDATDDVVFPDTTITIDTQPVNWTDATDPDDVTFTVVASATQGVSPTFQWQENSGGGWGNVTNGGVYSGATTVSLLLTGIDKLTYDGYQYRVIVDATGASSNTISDVVSVTFA